MRSSPAKVVADPTLPALEHYPEPGGRAQRIVLDPLPFRVGRSGTAQFVLDVPQISKEHAEFFRIGGQLRIRDLRSTNGTFVNGERIEEALLVNGDIVHLAHQEYRFVYDPAGSNHIAHTPMTELANSALPSSLIRGGEHLRELLREHCVRIIFQPIVELDTTTTQGYEALGRGTHSGLSLSPGHLFKLAERCGLASELSQLFRLTAAREAAPLPDKTFLFLNSHPAEIADGSLLAGLRAVQSAAPAGQQIVLEVHEDAVADLPTLRRLREELKALRIQLAYDDFGAGQCRLAELAEVPPDFIKLDMRLVRGINLDGARQNLVQMVSRLTREFGVQVIAEGIETAEEAAVCLRLGCQYGQGYLFGQPQAANSLEQKKNPDTHLFDLSELRQRLGFQRS